MDMKTRARALVDAITAKMVERGHPVEMTHKTGFRPDFLPIDYIGGWEKDFEGCLAMALIEGWHSKAAIRELVRVVREETAREAASRSGATKKRLAIVMEGGILQAVVTDDEELLETLDVVFIDYDTDGADEDTLIDVQQGTVDPEIDGVAAASATRVSVESPVINLDQVWKAIFERDALQAQLRATPSFLGENI